MSVDKIIGLDGNREQSETDGHVDGLACFIRPGVVLAAVASDVNHQKVLLTREKTIIYICLIIGFQWEFLMSIDKAIFKPVKSQRTFEEVVRSIEGLCDEYEVVVDKLGDVDRIKLKVELMPGLEDRVKEIESRLKDQLRLKTNLGYRIEFYDYGKLPRYAVKAKRFKDLRKK